MHTGVNGSSISILRPVSPRVQRRPRGGAPHHRPGTLTTAAAAPPKALPSRSAPAKSPAATAQSALRPGQTTHRRGTTGSSRGHAATIHRKRPHSRPSGRCVPPDGRRHVRHEGRPGRSATSINCSANCPSSDLVDRAKLLLAKTHARASNLDLALPLLSEVRSLSTDPAVKAGCLAAHRRIPRHRKRIFYARFKLAG